MPAVLFSNAALLDPAAGELLEDHHVLVEDGIVREVSDRPLTARGARVIDLAGRTLMPGLIDLHVHVMATQLDLGRASRAARRAGHDAGRAAPGGDAAAGLHHGARCRRRRLGVEERGCRRHGRGAAPVRIGPCAEPDRRPRRHPGPIGLPGGRSPAAAAFAPARCRGSPTGSTACAGPSARNCRWAPTRSRSWPPAASPRPPIRSPPGATPTTRFAAIVHEAAARQTYVMAHAYTAEAIERVVRLGVRTIEHGNLVDEPVAALMAAQGALHGADAGDLRGAGDRRRVRSGCRRKASPRSRRCARPACRRSRSAGGAGVRIGFGTDLLGRSQRLQSDEFRIRARGAVAARDDPQRHAGRAREVLQKEGRLGRLVPGAYADLLVVDGNPLADLSCLWGHGGQGERITAGDEGRADLPRPPLTVPAASRL